MKPSRETRELIRARSAEVKAEKTEQEKKFIQGRWVTEPRALQNRTARHAEQHSRRVPKRLAQVSRYTAPEDTDNGLELEDREVADRVTQADIVAGVDVQTQQKKFDLVLDRLGPYKVDFTRNGTHMLLAGLRGHLANLHWKDFRLAGETQLKDKINDATFLVDHTMTAVAQKRFVYMYTKEGAEMHILSKMMNMDRLGYLSRHMLLVATSSAYSIMQYLDVSTGAVLGAKVPSVMRNPTTCLAVNPTNGVTATCDLRGVVKFWSPSVLDPLIQLKGHRGAIEDIRFHPNGRFFLTLGGDHKMKVWDCRTLRALEDYAVTYAFHTLDISSTGLVALGGGTNVHIWRGLFTEHKPSAPYLRFGLGYANQAARVRFCPFEDVLGVGHARGFASFIVPGSGEANPDFYNANPHETERHRSERVVSSLLDKLPPDTISMDVQIAGVNEERLAAYNERLRLDRRARMIREKKQRRADRALAAGAGAGDSAPTGLPADAAAADDEVDEDIGYREAPRTRELKTRLEKIKEKKAKKWDKKDSSDKVRSKQISRHSRQVQQQRRREARERIHGVYQKDALDSDEDEALAEEAAARKKARARQRLAREEEESDFRFLSSGGGGGDDDDNYDDNDDDNDDNDDGNDRESRSVGGGGAPPYKRQRRGAVDATNGPQNAALRRFM